MANFGIRYPLFNIRYLLTSIFLFFCSITIAQIPDTIPTYDSYLDSLNANDNIPSFSGVMDTSNYATEIDTVSVLKKKKVKSPKKAAILGLAIPGAGHIYNKKYWKAPVIWGAFAGGVYAIQYNTSRHKLMKDAYCAKLVIEEVRDMVKNPCPEVSSATSRQKEAFRALTGQDLTGELPPETSRFDSAAIKRFRDSFDKNTQLSWIALIGGHLVLNGVWSYVDGHLNEFDIDEDLSLKLRPSFETIALSNASFVGASIVLEF
ncbi:MAG: DUF5683 domain-containing protein [Bacteroidota bacterium]